MTVNDFLPKKKRTRTVSRPRLSGKVAAPAVGRGKREQKQKDGFYRAAVNIGLSFLNGGKNPYDCYVINRNCL